MVIGSTKVASANENYLDINVNPTQTEKPFVTQIEN